jgi:hypothetical protein
MTVLEKKRRGATRIGFFFPDKICALLVMEFYFNLFLKFSLLTSN